MDFKTIEKKYRPIPFWSWNAKLNTVETKNQIRLMDEAGMGGFFMHARGGQMDAPATEPILSIKDVTSSVEWGTYPKEGTIDGIINDQTQNRWTGYGAQWICYDLGSVQNVHSLALAPTNSSTRQAGMTVSV